MRGHEIRSAFLRFFEERGHRVVPSSSLIPPNPSLLLTTAGMVQFIPYFLGHQEPPYPRAASAQKSFRANDIENVGHTARHLTFFEMLGNFSFGDYFKKDAIRWAHELITEGFGIDHDRLWVTVYEGDDDAAGLWVEEAGLAPERIVRRGKVDEHGEPANFWWTHTAGPCGPCSEIFVDRGPEYGPDGGPAVDEERFMEIWNLVFMQDECDDRSDVIRELPRKNIDTGSSLERVAVVLQGVPTVFDTDLLRPLVDTAERLSGVQYGSNERADVSLRVLAEHGRATTFLIADGVLPSNEGRGYVLRRMLRRLVTHARRLGVDGPVASELVATTVEVMGEVYPELVQNRPFILQVTASEEERFGATYRLGMDLFSKEVETQRAKRGASRALSGEAAFRLHDTFGFPIESTIELAAEEGLTVDRDVFARLMDEQRTRARDSSRKVGVDQGVLGEVASSYGPTEFVGYERLESDARIRGVVRGDGLAESAGEGERIELVLDRTPFYAEGGGQVGDAGTITAAGGVVRVTDTRPGPGGTIVHEGVVESGEIRPDQDVRAVVDAERREATARSHTATHVLHHTLREFLGEHARQAGSLVAPGRLRFDFTHYEPVPRDALEEIEYRANRRLADDRSVRAYETTADFARSQGAIALFGEKYGDVVRVVEVGDYSIELCGGTHVAHTGEVAVVRLMSEGSIGSGFRRIEALTGPDALKQVNVERRMLQEVTEALGATDPASAAERARHALARIKQLESELGKIRHVEQGAELERLAGSARDVAGAKLVVARLVGRDEGELRDLAPRLAARLGGDAGDGAVVVLGVAGDRGARLVAAVTRGLAGSVSARQLLEEAARMIGGGAGGRDTLAMAGGPKGSDLDTALQSIPGRLRSLLTGG